ncbi:MAG TPA: NifU family protein, partial [Saprospiraceae bacterium]|nr:NifU family protein [Saprospiraceae bacterium]
YLCVKLLAMTEKQEMLDRIEDALSSVRPHLRVDGGDVEVVELTDDMHVKIRWIGMCEGCSMSGMTLRAGIQEAIRGKIPEIVGVEAVN